MYVPDLIKIKDKNTLEMLEIMMYKIGGEGLKNHQILDVKVLNLKIFGSTQTLHSWQ